MNSRAKPTNICQQNHTFFIEQILLIALVLLGYFVFKTFLFKESPETKALNEIKERKSREYLENYKKENEDC